VEDDNAPQWTEGKLITPTFTSQYDDRAQVTGVTVTDWIEEVDA